MRPPRSVVLALLVALVASGIAGPTMLAAPEGSPTATSVEALDLGTNSRSGFAVQTVDVSTSIAMDRERANARMERHSLAVAFEEAEDEQAQREVLFQAATDVEIAISSLRADRRDVREAYAEGSIDEATLLRASAVHMERARELHGTLDQIAEHADRIEGFSMQSRIESLRASLAEFDGPMSERVRSTKAGEHNATRLYVSASPNGTVLSTIHDGAYIREATRGDNWVPDSINSTNHIDAVFERGFDLYPVAFNSSQTLGRATGTVAADIYRLEVNYEQGTIVAYLDGDTLEVFYEYQRQPLDQIIPGPGVSAQENGVELTANRTRAGGPLRVAVTDNSTGEPMDARVVVGGHDEGLRTGADGTAWTLMPGETTDVVAVTDRGNVSVTVVPE